MARTLEDMTNKEIENFLKSLEHRKFRQQSACNEENKKLKSIESKILKLRTEYSSRKKVRREYGEQE